MKKQNGLGKNGQKVIENKNPILMRDVSSLPGNGLWCINTEKKRKPSAKKDISTLNTNPNLDIEAEFNKKIADALKFQVNDLTKKLQMALNSNAELEYNYNRLNGTKEDLDEKCKNYIEQINDQKERIDTLENNIINLNEALSNAKKEINRLMNENKLECEKTNNIYDMYQGIVIEKERKENAHNKEIQALKNKIEADRLDKENLMRTIQRRDGNIPPENEEKDYITKTNENNLHRFINENAELRKKISNEEVNKSKLNEIIKKKKEKIKQLKEELKGYKDVMSSYSNDARWNQDLVAQKDQQIKILKEKLKKLEEENKNLSLKIEKMKIKKPVSSTSTKCINTLEEIIPVKAKPYLFGPETPDT
jgi:chromosome segregation ATPase